MSQTIIGLNNPIAVKRWSATLFTDQAKESYWQSRFASKAPDAPTPVQILTQLESDAGDTITYDLFGQLTQKPVYGDAVRRGKEEALKSFTDKISIEQVWCGVNGGGRMTRKRTLHDLRSIGRQKMVEWWARWNDEMYFMYAAGMRGVNDDFIEDLDYTGYAGNAFEAPDNDHVLFGGDATSDATLASDDGMSLGLIDRAVTKAATMGGGSNGKVKIRPINIAGEKKFVLCMHSFQEHGLRTDTATTHLTWAEIQKAAAAAQGQRNPLFTGAMGEYRGVVLHSHQSVIRFNGGAAGAVPAARAQFMGAQALVAAYGSPGQGLRYDWNEETEDRGNQVVIGSSTIQGAKKTRFKGADFSGLSLDTYAVDPNA